MKSILTAMTIQGVNRLVVVSAYGAADSHQRNFYNSALWAFQKEKMIDKEHMEELIKQSDVDWIVVRPAALTNGPCTQRYRAGTDLHMKISSKISRADVADFMLRQLTDTSYVHKAPAITG
jgi:putative NADH-flavin reductase